MNRFLKYVNKLVVNNVLKEWSRFFTILNNVSLNSPSKRFIGFGGGQKVSLPASEIANRRVKFTSTLSNTKEYAYNNVDPDNANRYRYLANNWIDTLATWDGITSTLVHDNFDQYYIDHTDTPAEILVHTIAPIVFSNSITLGALVPVCDINAR